MEGEGAERSAGESAWRESVRGRMQVYISSLLTPPSRQPPSVFCSISEPAGALSSTTDKLGGSFSLSFLSLFEMTCKCDTSHPE